MTDLASVLDGLVRMLFVEILKPMLRSESIRCLNVSTICAIVCCYCKKCMWGISKVRIHWFSVSFFLSFLVFQVAIKIIDKTQLNPTSLQKVRFYSIMSRNEMICHIIQNCLWPPDLWSLETGQVNLNPEMYRHVVVDQDRFKPSSSVVSPSEGAGAGEQLIKRCDAVWQVLETERETFAPEAISHLSLG